MSNIKVTPEAFEKAVREALAEYGDDLLDISKTCAKEAGRRTSSELKAESPVGSKGKYARGWSHRAQKSGAVGYADVVYNRTDYQLIHLLEYPHATNRGGHYPANVDYTGMVARIEEKQVQQFMEEVMNKI